MMIFFIALQFSLLIFMLFHYFIPIPPFNDGEELKKVDNSFYHVINAVINGVIVLIALIITLNDYPNITLTDNLTIIIFYLFLTIVTILSWWIPYFFGHSHKFKLAFNKLKKRQHLLSFRDNIHISNKLHFIFHIQVWLCLLLAIYFYQK